MSNNINKIFAIGAHKTATRSLFYALQTLGYRTTHWENHEIITKSFIRNIFTSSYINNFDALTDLPVPLFYKKLDKVYPQSKFIITVRDVDSWIASVENMIGERDLVLEEYLFYKIKKFNKDKFIKKYLEHNTNVIKYFDKRPQDLLLLNITMGDGWNKLCNFLKKEIPKENFPYKNKGVYKKIKTKYKKIKFNNVHFKYRDNTVDETTIKNSIISRIFIQNNGLPEYKIKDNHIIIDIGAHIGVFSVHAAQTANKGKIYSFEPEPENFKLLKDNIKINDLKNIKIFQKSISDYNGTANLYYHNENWGHTITQKISDKSKPVNTISLEDFIKKNNIPRCDLLKLNCEGSEFEIIMNTPDKIFDIINNIFIVYHIDLNETYSIAHLITRLKKLNYKLRFESISEKRRFLIAYKNYEKSI